MNKNAVAGLQKWREANKGVAVEQKNPLEKSRAKPFSLRLAINAKCYECQGENADPGVIDRIRNCDSFVLCPLWAVRPYQIRKG